MRARARAYLPTQQPAERLVPRHAARPATSRARGSRPEKLHEAHVGLHRGGGGGGGGGGSRGGGGGGSSAFKSLLVGDNK